MLKHWLVATYKTNKLKELENNLINQKFTYYLPKIISKSNNTQPKEILLFPGYIFVNTRLENYSALKFTIGIKNIVMFGFNIPFITEEEIESMKKFEKLSKKNPINRSMQIGQDVFIAKGSLKGNMVKICSSPYRDRVDILISILGSKRRINIPENSLIL